MDVFLCLSNSGESDELLRIVPLVKRQGARLIAMTGNPASTLALEADVHLDSAVAQEACPLNLAPTASTTAALALGDALAIALLDARGFSEADFARAHPGGALGRRLLTHVADVMRKGESVPAVPLDASLKDALLEMTRGGIGMTAVVDARRAVAGIFTDGDLRRTLDRSIPDFDSVVIRELMTPDPRVIRPDALAVEAVQLMESYKVNQMLVVDSGGALIGALNMHDLFRAKVI
jgi:arabinose-5-phosphate isomerase